MSGIMIDMELNPSLWISLLNGVFVSIAFMIWHLIKVESESTNAIVDVDSNVKEEERQEIEDTQENKHLYVIPSLRKEQNLLRYGEYCSHGSNTEQNLSTNQYKEILPQNDSGKDQETEKCSNEEKSSVPVFKWPLHDNLIEQQLKSSNQPSISESLKSKLIENGIQRTNGTLNVSQELMANQIKISEIARQTGRSIPRKQVCVIFDRFEATSRPGLEHPSSDSPKQNKASSPKMRKPMKVDRNEKSKSEKKSFQKKKGLVENFTENINCKKSFIRTV